MILCRNPMVSAYACSAKWRSRHRQAGKLDKSLIKNIFSSLIEHDDQNLGGPANSGYWTNLFHIHWQPAGKGRLAF
jgi:hypothetical protein